MSLKLQLPLAQSNLHSTEARLGVAHSEPCSYSLVKGTRNKYTVTTEGEDAMKTNTGFFGELKRVTPVFLGLCVYVREAIGKWGQLS